MNAANPSSDQNCPRVKTETENFRRFKDLCDELVELSIAWSKAKNVARNAKKER